MVYMTILQDITSLCIMAKILCLWVIAFMFACVSNNYFHFPLNKEYLLLRVETHGDHSNKKSFYKALFFLHSIILSIHTKQQWAKQARSMWMYYIWQASKSGKNNRAFLSKRTIRHESSIVARSAGLELNPHEELVHFQTYECGSRRGTEALLMDKSCQVQFNSHSKAFLCIFLFVIMLSK